MVGFVWFELFSFGFDLVKYGRINVGLMFDTIFRIRGRFSAVNILICNTGMCFAHTVVLCLKLLCWKRKKQAVFHCLKFFYASISGTAINI